MPGVGRRTLVQIGTTVHELRQATMGDPAGPALNRRGIETAPQAVARIRKGSAPLGRPSPGKLRALEARRAWTVPGRTTSMPPPRAAGNGTQTRRM